ncbi:peptide deformylase [Kineosporia sp. NBRC 101731]|uniref:peptide deformylase n=1 Tax=Kineosporia sp. NBRC 101731 TaxID=3032199 RepID=UPI0024A04FB9|nr:peptide deformylase [Kineosporia sp. NBRC 101731]GLY32931.1 peptide deformylase [Kineosporia sp. NBRC 101731]
MAKTPRTPVPAPIRQLGDPVLRTKADPVTVFDASLAQTVELMFASMYEARGVGLAANQIGLSHSLFVMDCDGVVAVVANPRLTELSEETVTAPEGCLSVAGHSFPTARAVRATVVGQDETGAPIEITGEDEVARCLQHETDHLNGKVYLDRLSGEVRKRARAEVETVH